MSGTANNDDARDLKPGDRCIIVVDDVNYPTGTWSGIVTESEPRGTYIHVEAVITGPLERETLVTQVTPSLNYCVFPDTPSVRHFAERAAAARARVDALRQESGRRKRDHHELIEHLVRSGVLDRKVTNG